MSMRGQSSSMCAAQVSTSSGSSGRRFACPRPARAPARRSDCRGGRRGWTGLLIFLTLLPLAVGLVAPPETLAYDLLAWSMAAGGRALPELPSTRQGFRVETVVQGLESPWGMAFLPDGDMLVTERAGRLRLISGGRLDPAPVAGTPRVSFAGGPGQGGLMDVVLAPDFAASGHLYLTYTVNLEGGEATRLTRFTYANKALTAPKEIYTAIPAEDAKSKHFGCRVRFGPDGKLYMTLGERGQPRRAQDLNDPNGKTLRLNPDGSIPQDNPFTRKAGARPEIFTWGNRNSQGIAFQPGTGLLWSTEHGPSWNDAPGGGDEINILLPGNNYGWPVVHHRERKPGMTPPAVEYTPAIAPAGCVFYQGDAFPAWRGDFLFANLLGQKLIRIAVKGERPMGQEVLLDSFGRLRDVAVGPDGLVYVLTSDTDAYGPGRQEGDRLLRLVPSR